MHPEDLSAISSVISQMLLGVLFVVGVIALRVYLFWRRLNRRRQDIERHNDAGTIGPTGLVQGAVLPWHYDQLAHVGTGGQAAVSLDQRVLKPSVGVKLFVLGLCAAMMYFVTQVTGQQGELQTVDPGTYGAIMNAICLFAALNGVVYIFTFETRYDRDMLIVTRMMFVRREYRWKNLWRIADDGAYELHLFFEPGGKAKVLKHSVGIEEFKDFALAQIRRNRTANA
ncbi:hypothetical protein [Tabrizicola sp.]|uniref:hypothetical protein n=1 Tax=Tabrizicola sp. TaxID=2005166 RepID=UPI003F3E2535